MTEEIEYKLSNGTVTVLVTVIPAIEECKQDMKSPFKFGERSLPPEINPNNYESVFIRCEIPPQKGKTVLLVQPSFNPSGQEICLEVAQEWLKKKHLGKTVIMFRSVLCNEYEQQYQFLIG